MSGDFIKYKTGNKKLDFLFDYYRRTYGQTTYHLRITKRWYAPTEKLAKKVNFILYRIESKSENKTIKRIIDRITWFMRKKITCN